MFKDKVLLITGGTGSFGNAVLERFLDTDIAEIRIFSRDEKKQDDMRKQYRSKKIKFYVGDVRDYQSILSAMSGVDYVFHAAALKQVPSCEFYPMQAVNTNVIGTNHVITAAIAHHVKKVICLSTDKAVYPVNAMGMSKAMMEKIVVAKSRELDGTQTTVCTTRYGNVIASRGSVIPLFIDQIKQNRPISITDPAMTRFMMSLEQAVDLVLFAFENGTNGDIFVQKAPSATIGLLAKTLKEIFNKPSHEIKIIGTRHGEKRYESLLTVEEMAKAIDMGQYYRIPADIRDLNYDEYFDGAEAVPAKPLEYNSENTYQLNQEELTELLRNSVPEIKLAMKDFPGRVRKNVLITGANGFIGKNLTVYLQYLAGMNVNILTYTRHTNPEDLRGLIQKSDFIFHLAGENRPDNTADFFTVNTELTQKICALCLQHNPVPIVFSSSLQSISDNDYGRSKREAEKILENYAREANVPVYLYRLPNVFGKWIRPNYNSFVATLCHNIINDLPYQIDDLNKSLTLVYIDDVIQAFAMHLKEPSTSPAAVNYLEIPIVYQKKISEIVNLLRKFKTIPENLTVPRASDGFVRALYAMYQSYLRPDQITYQLKNNADARGSFYEVFKTQDSGQVSISTTAPGITRGNHFHHTKNEKFLVVKGKAQFRFRHVLTNEEIEITTNASSRQVVEVPTGYTHNFTNIGDDELVMLLWANEAFDKEKADTYFMEV